MEVFYGNDNYLLNEAVTNFIKQKNLNFISNTYYLEAKTLSDDLTQIVNEISTKDILDQAKTIIINDYDALLNQNSELVSIFFVNVAQFTSANIILKILTNNLKLGSATKDNQYFIQQLTKAQLKTWILNFVAENHCTITIPAVLWIINNFPKQINIIKNELTKITNLSQNITLNLLTENSHKYFSNNVYELIADLLRGNYQKFWNNYCQHWTKINYDKAQIFNLIIFQLELMRNIKILAATNMQPADICQKLQISVAQLQVLNSYKNFDINHLNSLLLQAQELDFKIKNGKSQKNIGIDLYFLKF